MGLDDGPGPSGPADAPPRAVAAARLDAIGRAPAAGDGDLLTRRQGRGRLVPAWEAVAWRPRGAEGDSAGGAGEADVRLGAALLGGDVLDDSLVRDAIPDTLSGPGV